MLASEPEALEFLRFWVQSIHLHTKNAPIVIIGTHADILTSENGAAEKINDTLESEFGKFDQIQVNKENGLQYFPLDNLTTSGISNVRRCIQSVSKSQSFLHIKVSIKWLRCLDILSGETEGSHLSFKQVANIAEGLGIADKQELKQMLGFFHELGVIVHFTTTVALENMIITNPQWLINELGKVIRDERIHKRNMQAIKTAGLKEDIYALNNRAIASLDLLQYFWGRENAQFFTDLMLRTLLMSNWPYSSSQDKLFLIPGLLPDRELAKFGDCYTCKVRFQDNFLPDGYFQRLTCLCLGLSAKYIEEPFIAKRVAKLKLVNRMDEVCLRWVNHEIVIENTRAESSAEIVSIIQRIMRKINEDVMNSSLSWTFEYYDREQGVFLNKKSANEAKLSPWFRTDMLLISDEKNTTIDVDSFVELLH